MNPEELSMSYLGEDGWGCFFILISAVMGISADLSLIDVIIGMSAQPSPSGEGIFFYCSVDGR